MSDNIRERCKSAPLAYVQCLIRFLTGNGNHGREDIKCANSYQRRKWAINYWRSTAGHEVDLLFGDIAIEIKSTKNVSKKHLKGLKALREEGAFKSYFLVSRDQQEKSIDGITCLYYENFLGKVWDKEI